MMCSISSRLSVDAGCPGVRDSSHCWSCSSRAYSMAWSSWSDEASWHFTRAEVLRNGLRGGGLVLVIFGLGSALISLDKTCRGWFHSLFQRSVMLMSFPSSAMWSGTVIAVMGSVENTVVNSDDGASLSSILLKRRKRERGKREGRKERGEREKRGKREKGKAGGWKEGRQWKKIGAHFVARTK